MLSLLGHFTFIKIGERDDYRGNLNMCMNEKLSYTSIGARGWSELTKPVQSMHQYKRSGFVRQDKLRVRLRNSSAMRQVELEEHGHELLDPDTRGRFADLS
jgi:hypothetical protein